MAFVHEKKSVLNVNWITFFMLLCSEYVPPPPNITFIPLPTVKVTILKGLVSTSFLFVAVCFVYWIKRGFL